MRFLLAIFISALVTTSILAQIQFFPRSSPSDIHADELRFRDAWYSKQLKGLNEPSLWALSKTKRTQSYRFLWLRTFHHPVAVRIDLNDDRTAKLTIKVANGAGGYDPGKLIQDSAVSISKEQTDWFLEKIEEHRFWKLPSEGDRGGLDGSQWIVEGIKDGVYHMVDRWTPTDGDVRAIGLVMLQDLAKVKVPSKEFY